MITRAPWQPTLVYPARGVAALWEEVPPAQGGLARVVGAGRARPLAAGLVTRRRGGRTVLYLRTPAADGLVRAAPAP